MNYMKQVAEMLDVELHEEFYILEFDEVDGSVDRRSKWYLDEEGLCNCTDAKSGVYDHSLSDYILSRLLCGEFAINKIPWEPKNGETFYRISSITRSSGEEYYATNDVWLGSGADYALYVCGNCFKTRAEAEAAIPWYKANIERVNRGEKRQVEHDRQKN